MLAILQQQILGGHAECTVGYDNERRRTEQSVSAIVTESIEEAGDDCRQQFR